MSYYEIGTDDYEVAIGMILEKHCSRLDAEAKERLRHDIEQLVLDHGSLVSSVDAGSMRDYV